MEGDSPGEDSARIRNQHSQGPPNEDRSNEAGAKAIAQVHDKLQGYEDSTSGEQQGVEGQVQLLIDSARDAQNLCQLFYGWSPWI